LTVNRSFWGSVDVLDHALAAVAAGVDLRLNRFFGTLGADATQREDAKAFIQLRLKGKRPTRLRRFYPAVCERLSPGTASPEDDGFRRTRIEKRPAICVLSAD
jgi:hypothetical protein